MTNEKAIEILMKDGCTRSEAEKFLNKGTIVFDDFEEFFDSYMQERGIDEEEQEEYKQMIATGKALPDWGVVEDSAKRYYIEYAL